MIQSTYGRSLGTYGTVLVMGSRCPGFSVLDIKVFDCRTIPPKITEAFESMSVRRRVGMLAVDRSRRGL